MMTSMRLLNSRFQEPADRLPPAVGPEDLQWLIVSFVDPLLRLRLNAQEWQYLWDHFGLAGLLSLLQAEEQANWDALAEEATASEIVDGSLVAGYDPVSGLFGRYDRDTHTFEIDPLQ